MKGISAVLALLVILPLPSFPISTDGESNTSAEQTHVIIQRGLQIIMEEANATDTFEVIVQFYHEVNDDTIDLMNRTGFSVFEVLDLINGIYAEGTKEAILELAKRDDVKYIEYNAPLQYYLNLSARTIMATDVWDRAVLRDSGEETIDGTGITIVVLDSGIDATHPDLDYTPRNIEAGEKPRKGDKVIFNAKQDQGSDQVNVWIQFIDTDTTSGHGTHCAAIAGGLGEASAWDKRGIAPGVWLIGLSMGEGPLTIDEYHGLVWVYEHSRPGKNVANIRVVTNSWGPGWPFDALDPNEASAQVIERIVYENNVVVVFAAGNDGENDHDGHADTVNIFAKIPGAIGVAATERDGSGVAYFSSRGDASDVRTWPDVAAPGVRIWSAAARATLIGMAVLPREIVSGQGVDPYYLAISGTSMATPHVAGVAALLWQACPSLKVSDVPEDGYREDDGGNVYIHEVEWIMKVTADYISPSGDNGVPSGAIIGLEGHRYDFAQGYGLVNATKAVALALTLDRMRDPDHDGMPDREVTVQQAYKKYWRTFVDEMVMQHTNVITTSWRGEFVHPWKVLSDYLNQSAPYYGRAMPYTRLYREIFIPAETLTIHLILDVTQISMEENQYSLGNLYVTIDIDGDGNPDWVPDDAFFPSIAEHKEWYVTVSQGRMKDYRGRFWSFNVTGYNVGIAPRNEFKLRIDLELDTLDNPVIDVRGFRFGDHTDDYKRGTVTLHLYYYDVRSPEKRGEDGALEKAAAFLPYVLAGVIAGMLIYYHRRRKRRSGT